MTSVGVRALRQRASELLRLVEQGETVEITDRGRPVALLIPLPEGSPLDALSATVVEDAVCCPIAVPASGAATAAAAVKNRTSVFTSGS